MHDWWSPLIGMIIGFLFAWGVFELTEHRRRRRTQAAVRRALVAELGQAELVLSAIVFNLSIGTDHVADAVQELRWILQLGTERILRAGVLDLTTEEIEALGICRCSRIRGRRKSSGRSRRGRGLDRLSSCGCPSWTPCLPIRQMASDTLKTKRSGT